MFPSKPINAIVIGDIGTIPSITRMLQNWNGDLQYHRPLSGMAYASKPSNQVDIVFCSHHISPVVAPGLVNVISRKNGMGEMAYVIHSTMDLDPTTFELLADVRAEIVIGNEPSPESWEAAVTRVLSRPVPAQVPVAV